MVNFLFVIFRKEGLTFPRIVHTDVFVLMVSFHVMTRTSVTPMLFVNSEAMFSDVSATKASQVTGSHAPWILLP